MVVDGAKHIQKNKSLTQINADEKINAVKNGLATKRKNQCKSAS